MSLEPAEARDLEQTARRVARAAADVVARGYRSRPHAREKAKADLVTRFDLESEAIIVGGLREATPEIEIVAEESGGEARDGLVWYCDPLDGTTNFVHGHPFWSVSIGLMADATPILGVVIAPELGIEWSTAGNGTATRNGQPCRVSETLSLHAALVATGFPADRSHAPEDNVDAFVRVIRRVRGLRRCGSAAVDCCFVADGTYDGYWERKLNGWDLAGGAAIALAAGARMTALDGGRADLRRGHVVITNGPIHDSLVSVVRDPPSS